MEVANIIAHNDTVTITTVKSFIVQAPEANAVQLFTQILHYIMQ